MADWSGALWTERAIGASAGAAVSLVYMMPRGGREAACRFLAGVISGMVFGGPAGVLLSARLGIAPHLSPSEIMLSGAAAVSVTAWWGLGVLARVAGRWGRIATGLGNQDRSGLLQQGDGDGQTSGGDAAQFGR